MADAADNPNIRWSAQAADEIRKRALAVAESDLVCVIAITGPVGAGKSTVAAGVSPLVVRSDDYLPDYELVPEAERDHPEASDLARLAADLSTLRQGQSAVVPRWSFQTHRREGERLVEPGPVVVVEGIHAFEVAERVRLDLMVYVEAPRSTRWSRWEAIEAAGDRGWGVERAKAYFENVAEPAFGARERRLRAMAHLIVVND